MAREIPEYAKNFFQLSNDAMKGMIEAFEHYDSEQETVNLAPFHAMVAGVLAAERGVVTLQSLDDVVLPLKKIEGLHDEKNQGTMMELSGSNYMPGPVAVGSSYGFLDLTTAKVMDAEVTKRVPLESATFFGHGGKMHLDCVVINYSAVDIAAIRQQSRVEEALDLGSELLTREGDRFFAYPVEKGIFVIHPVGSFYNTRALKHSEWMRANLREYGVDSKPLQVVRDLLTD